MEYRELPDSLKEIEISTGVTDIGKDVLYDLKNMAVINPKDSYAEQYCNENNVSVKQP